MPKHSHRLFLTGGLFTCLMATYISSGCLEDIRTNREPGGRADDLISVRRDPEAYAWTVFCYLNRQANPGAAGRPDPHHASLRSYDEDRDVVWETWARSWPLVGGKSEVFATAEDWVAWDQLKRPETPQMDQSRGLQCSVARSDCTLSTFKKPPSPLGTILEEVRMNQAAYKYIHDHQLGPKDELAKLYRTANSTKIARQIDFPFEAKIVKALWEPLRDRDRRRFHWRNLDPNCERIVVLVALHVVTKDAKNWTWSSFIHKDHESDSDGASTSEPWTTTVGSKWENYRLLGTQTEFTDAQGAYTTLWNDKIEANRSSCISCHAHASVTTEGRGVNPLDIKDAPFGVPDEKYYWKRDAKNNLSELLKLPTDFVWAISLNAH